MFSALHVDNHLEQEQSSYTPRGRVARTVAHNNDREVLVHPRAGMRSILEHRLVCCTLEEKLVRMLGYHTLYIVLPLHGLTGIRCQKETLKV